MLTRVHLIWRGRAHFFWRARTRFLWRAFLRMLILFLALITTLALYLGLVPGAFQGFLQSLPLPGVVRIPAAGQTPPAPLISAPRGEAPRGNFALRGETSAGAISCGFLLEMGDGRRVGISAAHATPVLASQGTAFFHSLDGKLTVPLGRQIGRGQTFTGDGFTTDYVIWSLAGEISPEHFLKPDLRERVEVGEGILVYSPMEDSAGASRTFLGVVMSTTPGAVWIQLEEAFDPRGFSGCPVVSRHTGRFVGMAVAGENKPPVVIGLNPAHALVKQAIAALDRRK